jgi:hypothetical protein
LAAREKLRARTRTFTIFGARSMTEGASEQTINHAPADDADGWEWMLVEIMGHRTHWGRARQEERFGAKMLRIDVPNKGDPAAHGWSTHYYGGASIFSFTLTDEATVIARNKPYEPPSRLSLPAPEDDEDFPFDDGGPYNEDGAR